jgi:hypothetical protein
MAIAENIGYNATNDNTNKLLSREQILNEKGENIIIETHENDLFTLEITKYKQLDSGKETEFPFKEIILPDTGITGELKRFIAEVIAGQDSFFL